MPGEFARKTESTFTIPARRGSTDFVPARDARRQSRPDDGQVAGTGWRSRFAIKASSRPASAFTGDFFFASEIDGALWFAVGDFAGHGLKATIFMSIIQEELERLIRSCSSADPAEVVASLDRAVRDVIPFNRFATLVVGREMPDGSLQLVNAGHCPPFIVRKGADPSWISSHGPVVGLLSGAAWRQETIRLEGDELLVLYTDGIVEAAAEDDLEFGVARLHALVRDLPYDNLIDGVLDEVDRFTGGRQDDDRTLFVLRPLR